MGNENRIPLTDGARGFALLDTDTDLTSDSDWRVSSQKAIKAYVDAVDAKGISMVSDSGQAACAYIDFNDAGEAEMSVTIDGVAYTEADEADAENGLWTNGASAAASATSLIAAINGDTRATVPFTAVADASGDGVWLFWDAVGAAGNVTITTDSASNCTVQNSYGGAAAGTKQSLSFTRTVVAQDLLSGALEFPLPFTPATVIVQVYTSTGAPVYFTDLVTVESDPTRLRITTDGATNIAATNVVHVTVTG